MFLDKENSQFFFLQPLPDKHGEEIPHLSFIIGLIPTLKFTKWFLVVKRKREEERRTREGEGKSLKNEVDR